ncbi:hypothetical protein DPEC_G00082500 [Dallia pectoralis]|uniref:Uncharacterized protein n=1 Tax=Dallia pectoralis TaxID=75939 RepID=A0ACC2GZK1_DALPE|nr:hypothetical protein DPEC_G00082500 [Dallia pectoralis]
MAKLNVCLKRIFIFFNLFFAVVGGLILGLGLVGRLFYQRNTAEWENQTSGFTVMFVVGGVTIAISLVGAYGAQREKRIPLIVFLTACFVACFGLLRLAVPAAIYHPMLENDMEGMFRAKLPLNKAPPGVQEVAESIQQTLKCCGLFSYTDWGHDIPNSCLCQDSEDEIEGKCQYVQYQSMLLSFTDPQKLIYKQTCFPVLKFYLSKAMDIFLGVFFGLAALALLGAVISAVLLAQLMKSTVGVPVVFSVSSLPAKRNIWSQPPKYTELYNEPEK